MGAMGKFDDRQFQAFVKQFDSAVKGEAYLREIEKAFRDITAKTLKIVKKRSPVDKGVLRRNWSAGSLKVSKGNMMVEIFNNTEYAIYVEMGHRPRGGKGWVKGKFFLEDSINEINEIMDEVLGIAFERALAKLLEG